MINLQLLNSRERKRLLQRFAEQYGCETDFLKGYAFLLQETKRRYFIARKELLEAIDIEALKVESLGLYLCSELKNGDLRLSIEGSQLIGPSCTKNVLELSDAEFSGWIRGRDVEKETELRSFVIIRHGDDFIGSGKPVLDEKTGSVSIHNYIPKTRYVRSDD